MNGHPASLLLPALLVAASACAKDDATRASSEPAHSATAAAAPSDTPKPAAAAAATAAPSYGPTVAIPAGSFNTGSACHDVPRARADELESEAMSLGEYTMDVHPYPNESGKPAMTNVSWKKAGELCAARGKRLCSELEWERACKGPKSTTFPWGNAFNTKKCDGQKDLLLGQRADCKSEFGVMDMVGVAMEWTASDWKRGAPTGAKVIRGARAEKVSALSARCAHSRKRAPTEELPDVGFRCCSGPESSLEVVLAQKKQDTLVPEAGIDAEFSATLLKGMPKDHREIPETELTFDDVVRWHPVANEELILASWNGKPAAGPEFRELAVFKLCGGRAHLAAKMRGPVSAIGKPKVATTPEKVTFDVTLGDDKGEAKLSYWYGTVKLVEPDWLKAKSFAAEGSTDEKKLAKDKLPAKLRLKLPTR